MKTCFLIVFQAFLFSALFAQVKVNKDSFRLYDLHIKKADSLYEKEAYLNASNEYRKALYIAPDDSMVIDNYLNSLLKSGNGCTAYEDLYSRVMEGANLCFENKMFEKAKEFYLAALQIYPFKKEPRLKLEEIKFLENDK